MRTVTLALIPVPAPIARARIPSKDMMENGKGQGWALSGLLKRKGSVYSVACNSSQSQHCTLQGGDLEGTSLPDFAPVDIQGIILLLSRI